MKINHIDETSAYFFFFLNMRELIWYNDPWGLHNGFYVSQVLCYN
jgi:hypothetical protein